MKTFYQYIKWMRSIRSDFYHILLTDESLRISLKTMFTNLEDEFKR